MLASHVPPSAQSIRQNRSLAAKENVTRPSERAFFQLNICIIQTLYLVLQAFAALRKLQSACNNHCSVHLCFHRLSIAVKDMRYQKKKRPGCGAIITTFVACNVQNW